MTLIPRFGRAIQHNIESIETTLTKESPRAHLTMIDSIEFA